MVLWFPLGLAIDALGGLAGTAVTTLGTFALFAAVYRASSAPDRRILLVCVAWATVGELVLTEVLGLYQYRIGFLPPFVPPGHALLFQLGLWSVAGLSARLLRALRVSAIPLTIAAVVLLDDHQSLVFLAVFVALLRFGPSPAIYGAMFFLALALELIGTAIGTWTWAPRDPWLGIQTFNPPIAAGVFYCLLDALTLGRRRGGPPVMRRTTLAR